MRSSVATANLARAPPQSKLPDHRSVPAGQADFGQVDSIEWCKTVVEGHCAGSYAAPREIVDQIMAVGEISVHFTSEICWRSYDWRKHMRSNIISRFSCVVHTQLHQAVACTSFLSPCRIQQRPYRTRRLQPCQSSHWPRGTVFVCSRYRSALSPCSWKRVPTSSHW